MSDAGPMNKPPRIRATPRAVLAAALSGLCVLSLGMDWPAQAASPSKDKKAKPDPVLKGLPITELSEDEAVLHALNRLAYGPRPGDIDRVRQMGLAKWIDQQLNPNSIDDKALEARLEEFPTLRMSTSKLLEEYPRPNLKEKQAQRPARPAPDNAATTVASDRREERGRMQADLNGPPDATPATTPAMESATAAPSSAEPSPMKQTAQSDEATSGRKNRRVDSEDPNAVPRALADDSRRPQRIVEELAMAKMTRAIYSERQLQQVMDDFWFNHFNVFAGKGEDRWYLTSYERDVIQPHTLGKFKDLLKATAKSPAMLFYLDNYLSADPNAQQRIAQERAMRQQMRYRRFGGPWPARPAPRPANKDNVRGLNENYGRELMELHTLSVNGGYTQKDVTEVARCFTGWTIEKPRVDAGFKFDDRLHDPGTKIVLGKKIHAGGMGDGEQVLDLLAKSPQTAHFISLKLARRFVSDNPPDALIERMASTFESSDGDIRAVMHTMIYSPEFWSRRAYQAKMKTPSELVVSAARALGADVGAPMALVQWTARIGEPLYGCQPPTGYTDKADAWVNTGALLTRLNYSLALAGNRVRGVHSDVGSLLGLQETTNPKEALDRALQVFLGGQAAPSTVATLEKQMDNPQVLQAKLDDPVKQVDLGIVAGLVLGAPEFQRR
jgi:uncharacterized protein (DUF1800 family)